MEHSLALFRRGGRRSKAMLADLFVGTALENLSKNLFVYQINSKIWLKNIERNWFIKESFLEIQKMRVIIASQYFK